jgi:hypothetical protein
MILTNTSISLMVYDIFRFLGVIFEILVYPDKVELMEEDHSHLSARGGI